MKFPRSFESLLVLVPAILVSLPSGALAAPTFEDQVMEIVNVERWNNGNLPPLKRNAALDLSSETHSTNMADRNFFMHCDPDNGTLPWNRMTTAGYVGWASAAENIAAGYTTPAAVMTGWMNSSGHRTNILSTNYREIGIGYFNPATDANNIRTDSNGDCTPEASNSGPYNRYWTQNFGRINTVFPVVINREAYETTTATVNLYVYGTGYTEMRFRNENGAWSAWQPYNANAAWTLSAGNGTKTVNCEIRSGTTVRSASDTIELNAPGLDLAVSLVDMADPGTIGTNLAYQATLTNSGASTANSLTLTSTLPANVTFVSSSHPYTLNGSTLVMTVASLGAGANTMVQFVVLPTSGSSVSQTVTLAASQYDPNMANNADTESTDLEASTSDAGPEPGPAVLALGRNQPNPFRSGTRLTYSLPADGPVRLAVYDASGREVAVLVERIQAAGVHEVAWNGKDASGQDLAGGVYFSRLVVGEEVRTSKLMMIR